MKLESLLELEKEVSRRGFLTGAMRSVGGMAALVPFLEKIASAQAVDDRQPYNVLGAIGRIVIPEDEDPGWRTFEPAITNYALDIFIGQVFLNGNSLAIGGFKNGLTLLNSIPVSIQYNLAFLEMSEGAKLTYFSDILTRQFVNDGVQEILDFIFILALVATKATFFSNFPRHLAVPGAEFQVLPVSSIKTGWDIMRWKGPVGPTEEAALRAKYFDAPTVPGVDPTNRFI